ncbi:hypothetical protein WJX72_009079 [[Myrmecia] bisecta]|uniref:START domain-containing protein n=1 Tax=[Myrmecia] bisecta TaxID=41462 RepID=A0AAW1QB49_9CHLO
MGCAHSSPTLEDREHSRSGHIAHGAKKAVYPPAPREVSSASAGAAPAGASRSLPQPVEKPSSFCQLLETWQKDQSLEGLSTEELLMLWDQDLSLALRALDTVLQLVEAKKQQTPEKFSKAELLSHPEGPLRTTSSRIPVGFDAYRNCSGLPATALEVIAAVEQLGREQSIEDSAEQLSGIRPRVSTETDAAAGSLPIAWTAAEDAVIKTALALSEDGRILAAHELLQSLCTRKGISYATLAAHLATLGLDAHHLTTLAGDIRKGMAAMRDDDGWTVSRHDELKVLYRHEKGTKVHSLKFEATFDCPLSHLLALAREFDLTSTWNRYVLDSTVIHEPSIFESFIYAAAWLPFPFTHQDVLLHARGADCAEEERCLFVMVNDVTESNLPADPAAVPAAAAKRRRAAILPGTCLRLEPLPPGPDGKARTRGTMLAHVDPQLPFVPAVLVNFVLKVMSPFAYNQMKAVLRDTFARADAPLPMRVKAKPHIYARVMARVAEFIPGY